MGYNADLHINVIEKLRFDPRVDESNITIGIRGENIVVLGGKVPSLTEKRLAEEDVESLEKVRGVANQLVVDLDFAYERNDVDIVKTALDSLAWTMLVPHEKIKISVDHGRLTLYGEVEYNFQKERAEKAVEDLYGVVYVTNNIKIKSNKTPVQVKEQIHKEFSRNARIDASRIKVEVFGSQVKLTGRVMSFDEAREVRRVSWDVPGVEEVVDLLIISQ